MAMVRSPAIRLISIFALLVVMRAGAQAQTLDTFNAGVVGGVHAIAVQPDGKILIGGVFSGVGVGCGPTTCTTARQNIARLNPDGSVDASFNPGASNAVFAIAIQPDGKILIGGQFTEVGGGTGMTPRRYIARLNADGSVDSFDPGASSSVHAILVQPDGRIVLGGEFSALGGGDFGTTIRRRIGRVEADGTLDAAFNPGANGGVRALARQSDGSIIVAGYFTTLGGGGSGTTARRYIGRVDADGDLDPTFAPGADWAVLAIAVEPGGRILVGGQFAMLGGGTGTTARSRLGRLESTGEVDSTFDPNVSDSLNTASVYALALQADGRILVAGNFATIGGQIRQGLGRVEANGLVDAAFAPGTFTNESYAMALDDQGRILVGGGFSVPGGGPRNRLARFLNTSPATETLTVTGGGTTLHWTRGGTSPELGSVRFDAMMPGAAWTPLGAGTREAGGWTIAGLNIAPTAVVRARGQHGPGAGSLVQSVLLPSGVNVVANPAFDVDASHWLQFATPSMSYIVSDVTSGVFRFYRNPPPAGTANQAVAFQETGVPVPAGAPLQAQFDLGNSDSVRKRISVLVHDSDFSDLSVCTFWLPAGAPIRTYAMHTHSTRSWTSATVSFYAASANAPGNTTGFYQLDNVSLQYMSAGAADKTVCDDPTAPTAPGGPDEATLLINGDFGSAINSGSGWTTFGQITGAVNAGVFEFIKVAGTPAGVVLQATTQPVAQNQILTSTFQLGNSSAVRKRVTVIMHDNAFGDLSACTFWLPPGQPLSTYAYRSFATQAWTNATLSVYPATAGADQWIRLDNVTYQKTPGTTIIGTECVEPGGAADALAVRARGAASAAPGVSFMAAADTAASHRSSAPSSASPETSDTAGTTTSVAAADTWLADGFAREGEVSPTGLGPSWIATASDGTARTLSRIDALDLTVGATTRRVHSWLSSAAGSRAEIQVSLDGVAWETIHTVAASDTWLAVDVDLSAYAGQVIFVRFSLDGGAPTDGSAPDVWRLDVEGLELPPTGVR